MDRELIGYVRVAPRERAEGRPDLAGQRAALAAAAGVRGWRLRAIEQDVRSGRSLRRPGLHAALDACRRGEADGVAVARLDRLTYSLPDLAELVRDAVEGGYSLVALEPDLDLAGPAGRAVGEVLTTAAGWVPRGLAPPARRALGERVGRPSSTPPAVAERIRRLRDEGMTLQAICDTLNAEGTPTPRGGRTWRPTSLRAILRAPRAAA